MAISYPVNDLVPVPCEIVTMIKIEDLSIIKILAKKESKYYAQESYQSKSDNIITSMYSLFAPNYSCPQIIEDANSCPNIRYSDSPRTLLECEERNNSYDSVIRSRTDAIIFLFECTDYFREERELVQVSMNYLDRYVRNKWNSRHEAKTKENLLPLDIIVLLFFDIAVKLFSPTSGRTTEFPPPTTYDSDKFTSLKLMCENKFSLTEFENAQHKLLFTLNFDLCPPTSYAFISEILEISPIKIGMTSFDYSKVITASHYQVELSLTENNLACVQPSLIAFASLENSINAFLVSESFESIVQENNGTRTDIFDENKLEDHNICIKSLIDFRVNVRYIFRARLNLCHNSSIVKDIMKQILMLWKRAYSNIDFVHSASDVDRSKEQKSKKAKRKRVDMEDR